MKTIILTDDAIKQINDLRLKTEDVDDIAAIQKALALYDTLTDYIIKGGVVFVLNRDGSRTKVKIF